MAILNTQEIPGRLLFPGITAKLIHTERVTIAHVILDAGSVVPEHSHPHEQIINVLQGTFEMVIGNEKKIVSAGYVGVVPPNVKHSVVTIEGGKILDVFQPVREDLK